MVVAYDDLKPFKDDGEACELDMFAFENNYEVEVFIEPKPVTEETTFMEKVREKGKGKKYEAKVRKKYEEEVDKSSESEGESIDEFMEGVHFDDSEEERMKGFDEGFDEGIDEGVDEGLNEGVDGEPRDGENPSEPPNNIFITQEMGKEHVSEEEYMTDELDSGANDDSCDDRPSVIRFKEDDALSKHFNFKVGMEFSSLEQFKKAILEHNVLIGREVRFGKK